MLGGEDIEETEEAVDGDDEEPTGRQKTELFRIHRNLGHPTPQDLGRALKHAGAKRNLIRWAVKELRCPVCEARVKPAARRPATLPRCMRFNETVGMDPVEFSEGPFEKIVLADIVCWGTGYHMAGVMKDKTSESARDAFAELWVKH